MTETTERFLQEIATRVGHDRVAELYLFPVLRQGGIEGAVAVVAAYPESQVTSVSKDAVPDDGVTDDATVPDHAIAHSIREVPEVSADDSPYADDAPTSTAESAGEGAEMRDETAIEQVPAAEPVSIAIEPAPRARHIVYTARYRHTVKGTDRGRWAVEVVAEGDAPLITVEEVVRGVVRRSGDAFQPERISGEQFRALVPAPAAPGSAPA